MASFGFRKRVRSLAFPRAEPEIYLDFAGRGPMAPAVRRAVQAAQREHWGNPGNLRHARGRAAARAVECARQQVAASIGARAEQVVFTSGATESNNLALQGLRRPGARHIVTCATEHPSVLEPCRALERCGRYRVTYLSVDGEGRISISQLEDAIARDTAMVTLMWANNEVGTVHDIQAVGAVTRRAGILLHCDATQALGKLPVDVERSQVDLLSLSGHKIQGPPGTGALYVRDPSALAPLLLGGGQQQGLRSGTPDTPGIVGLGIACRLAKEGQRHAEAKLRQLTQHARRRLRAIPRSILLTPETGAVPGIVSVAFEDVEAEALLDLVDGVALSTGSACHAMRSEPSHVAVALGISNHLLLSVVRLSMGTTTTAAELDVAVERIHAGVHRIRSLLPTRTKSQDIGVSP